MVEIVQAKPSDADRLSTVVDQIDAILDAPGNPQLVGPDGKHVELPRSVVQALEAVVEALARGEAVTVVSQGQELTSQQAADLIHVSRPFLIKLLDRGDLPFHKVGSHRRIRVEHALAYRERRDKERDAALRELTRLSEELHGGYR
ncbi:MAG: helix-turn-helix domain-containing protein [Solirubrobacteraceae bacterium]